MPSSPSAEIDPVETLMFAVGIKAIISREVEKIRQAQLREAVQLPKTIQKLARQLIAGEKPDAQPHEFHYEGTLKDLARGWEPEQVEQMMATLPPEFGVHTTGLIVRAKQILDVLQREYPQTNYVTATGSINLVPADKKIFKFVVVLEVLCDPLSVFALMYDGGLLPSQVTGVRTVFPTISDAIDAALLEATVSAKAKTKSFELAPRTEIGVRRWFGKGPLSDSGLKMAQSSVDANKDRREAQAAAPGLDKTEQTTSQRVESSL